MDFLWFIILGAVAGWLAGQIVRGNGMGLLGNIVVGILGAVLGGWLARQFHITIAAGLTGYLITSTFGAIFLLLILNAISNSRS